MNYDKVFRVFDNDGETVDRYTVFLANDPDMGSLGLSDEPDHPQGFSQWGDFDIDQVEHMNTEISFADLPDNVQDHVVDRFELTESDDAIEDMVCDVWGEVILSIMEGDKNTASIGIKGLIMDQFDTLMSGKQLNEFMNGAIKFRGDDVIVSGKVVGTITNDLDDYKRGMVFTSTEGDEQDFTEISELIKFIMDEFRIKESYITEATKDQKYVIKALRKLAKTLKLPKPRFSSIPSKAGVVELSVKGDETIIPNDLRKRAVVKVLNVIPTSFSDVDHGTITPKVMTLNVPQWEQLLSYYDIAVERPITEE